MGRILRGWALAAQGTTDAGIDELRGGLELARATGARMDAPYFLGLLADACARDGRHEEALAALDQALELVRRSRTYFFEAELHRLRGDVLLHTGRRDDGEASLERALEAAQRQGSPALELRAAVSLGQLRREQGRGAEAASIVGAAHAKFTEGFDTPDLVQGRALLEELEAPVPGPPSLPGSTEVTQPRAEPASPPVRYARSGDLNIAYQVIGDGRIDLVLVHGWVCSFQPGWENPKIARFYRRLASLGRLVLFDKRGTGLSDRVPSDRLPDLETRMDDVRAVMDAAGSERAIVIGISEGGAMSALFAATHPERVAGLVLLGTFARRMWAPDYPFGPTEEEWQAQQTPPDAEDWASAVTRRWLERTSPGIVRDEAAFRWYASYVTRGASPGAQEALARMNKDLDIRHVLPAIRVPTLVLYRSHEWYRDATRYMAERIQGAETVELPGADHIPWEGDQDALLDRIAAFVSRSAGAAPADGRRVLATILVADLVGSTETAARLGDRAWTELLARHERTVKEVLARFSGEVVDMAGDGVLALFDGPSRAIRAALTLRRELAQLDLPVRVGIHTGEIERVGHRPRGIAVHLAARVAGEAGPGEVLVTATTRDLVAGSGLAFSDRGERLLRGFDEPRRLHEAVA
jgi:pimeloyl-ACP methyl ester carboxylesterase